MSAVVVRNARVVGAAFAPRERRAQEVETYSRVRGEGEGIQLEAVLSEKCAEIGFGAAFSNALPENPGALMGSEHSEVLDLTPSDFNEAISSSLK